MNPSSTQTTMPRALGHVILRLTWTDGDIDWARQAEQLSVLIRNTDATELISVRVQEQRGVYLRVRGCPACTSRAVQKPPCFAGCPAQIVEHRMARYLLPGGSARRIARLAPRPVQALLLCWPTRAARPFPPAVLALGPGVQLVQRWRRGGQVLALMALEDRAVAPDIAAALRDADWHTRTVTDWMGQGRWLRYAQPVLGWWLPIRTTLAPMLLIPPLPGTAPLHGGGPPSTRVYSKSSTTLQLAPVADPPPLLLLGQDILLATEAEPSPDTADSPRADGWWELLWQLKQAPADAPAAAAAGGEESPPASSELPGAPAGAPAPAEPVFPALGSLLNATEVRDVIVELLTRFEGGITKNGLKKLFVGAGNQSERRARMVYLWLHAAGLLSEARDPNLPFREKRRLVVHEVSLICERLAATPIPTEEQLVAAAQLGSWGDLP